jgi:hypothetical protein
MVKSQRLSRPYARAVAGVPVQMEYIPDTRSFSFAYNIDISIMKPTEIYISPLVYPEASYNVTVSENIQ